jgi:predicted 3-demethylubiquinone-9 3-methyltransferase (glyoxalase superfamily)
VALIGCSGFSEHHRPTYVARHRNLGACRFLPASECAVPVLVIELVRTGAKTAAFALIEYTEFTNMKPKNTICLWFDKDAHEAARFYAATFPDSEVTAVHEAPADYPGGKKGDVLTVEFTVVGIPCLGLNGGPVFRHSEAFSFQIATETQEETDRYWYAITGNGGAESQCGWCKDRWGLSWQITPRALTDALAAGGGEARRAFEAMMTMRKVDIAAIEAARRG